MCFRNITFYTVLAYCSYSLISTYFVAYIIATSIINVTSEIVIREIFCVEIYLNKVLSVENMGLTQPPIEWVAGALSLGGTVAGA